MTDSTTQVLYILSEDIPALANYIRECMQNEPHLFLLKPSALGKSLGIKQETIRDAIQAGHYGYIHRVAEQPEQYCAYLQEARLYHLGGEDELAQPLVPGSLPGSSRINSGQTGLIPLRSGQINVNKSTSSTNQFTPYDNGQI